MVIAAPRLSLAALFVFAGIGCGGDASTTEPGPTVQVNQKLQAVAAPAPNRSLAPVSTMKGPRIRVLGVAQDGGLPHAACRCTRCEAARLDPARASGVASIGIIAPVSEKVFLIDATPDITAQLGLLDDVRLAERGTTDRAPLDGVLLTHAHMGHYLGLAYLGFEAVSTVGVPVWASKRMSTFLRANAPWDRLVKNKHISLRVVLPGKAIPLADRLTATPVVVPHRAEYTDTLAFVVKGPTRRILYLPDCSPWHAWETPPMDLLGSVDVALVDATFYSGDELPGRDLTKIGHPLVVDTMDLLQARVDAGKLEVWFIHLNHSNPALTPGSEALRTLEARGFHVAYAGLELRL
jgi:pyrroloquinoline quinone biosynthesis protein B